jgi:hypothetical protein
MRNQCSVHVSRGAGEGKGGQPWRGGEAAYYLLIDQLSYAAEVSRHLHSHERHLEWCNEATSFDRALPIFLTRSCTFTQKQFLGLRRSKEIPNS